MFPDLVYIGWYWQNTGNKASFILLMLPAPTVALDLIMEHRVEDPREKERSISWDPTVCVKYITRSPYLTSKCILLQLNDLGQRYAEQSKKLTDGREEVMNKQMRKDIMEYHVIEYIVADSMDRKGCVGDALLKGP